MMHGFRWGMGLSAMATVLGGLGMWRAERLARTERVEVPAPAFARLPSLPPLPIPPPAMDGAAERIRVKVFSASTGAPLAGARVSLIPAPMVFRFPSKVPDVTAVTDAAGVAVFLAPDAGLYSVCARGAGHAESCEEEVGVVAGGVLSVALRLPLGAVVEGQILQHDGSPAAEVRLVAPGEQMLLELTPTWTTTDAQGRYTLDGLTPGAYVQMALDTPRGKAMSRALDSELAAGEERRFDIQLGAFVPVTVKPVMQRQRGTDSVDGVSMTVPLTPREDGTWTGIAESGRQALFISGRRDGAEVAFWRDVTVVPGVPVVIPLPFIDLKQQGRVWPNISRCRDLGSYEVAGRVFMPDGSPVQGDVWVAPGSPGDIERCNNVARGHSHFRFEGSGFAVRAAAGWGSTVYAWLADGRAGSAAVTGRQGEHVVADIHLEETGAVTGVVVFEGEPLWGHREGLSIDGSAFGAWHTTRMDGSFFVPGLKPGKHVLTTLHGEVEFNVNAREVTNVGVLKGPLEPEVAAANP